MMPIFNALHRDETPSYQVANPPMNSPFLQHFVITVKVYELLLCIWSFHASRLLVRVCNTLSISPFTATTLPFGFGWMACPFKWMDVHKQIVKKNPLSLPPGFSNSSWPSQPNQRINLNGPSSQGIIVEKIHPLLLQ